MTGAVLEEYSKVRNKDAEAICDMSMDNYLEVLYTNCGLKPIITIIWQQTNAYKNWLKIIEYLFSYSLTLKYMFIHRNNCSFITLHLWLSDFLGFYFVTVKNWHGGCLSPPFVRRLARVMHCVMRGVHVCKLDIHEFGSKLWWETYLVSQCLFKLFLYLDKFLVYFLKIYYVL